jgi:hypothetical protein
MQPTHNQQNINTNNNEEHRKKWVTFTYIRKET